MKTVFVKQKRCPNSLFPPYVCELSTRPLLFKEESDSPIMCLDNNGLCFFDNRTSEILPRCILSSGADAKGVCRGGLMLHFFLPFRQSAKALEKAVRAH